MVRYPNNSEVTRIALPRLTTVFLVAVVVALGGCGTVSRGRTREEGPTLSPGWKRVRRAAVEAVRSPRTWAPLLGAVVVQIDDGDERISRWASEHHPVFGSADGAERGGDLLLGAAAGAYVITALAGPEGGEPGTWTEARGRAVAIGAGGVVATAGVVEGLKAATRRERPDGSGEDDFPSGHAALAASMTALASRNLSGVDLSETSKTVLRVGFDAIAAGTGWARVEARRHFPSDVLAGYALGHFVGAFVSHAFLGSAGARELAVGVEPSREGFAVSVGWAF